MNTRELILPSGRKLRIQLAPFVSSRGLYQAFLKEMKGLHMDTKQSLDANFFKDIFCTALSSKEIEDAIWLCMKPCLINDIKISNDLFEDVEHRDDYLTVMLEVGRDNLLPFTKSLSAQYGHILDMISMPTQA